MTNPEIIPGRPDICPIENCVGCQSFSSCREKQLESLGPSIDIKELEKKIFEDELSLQRNKK